jgi:hypothetical protein
MTITLWTETTCPKCPKCPKCPDVPQVPRRAPDNLLRIKEKTRGALGAPKAAKSPAIHFGGTWGTYPARITRKLSDGHSNLGPDARSGVLAS